MATLYVREYARLARDASGHVLSAGEEPAIASQKLTYTTAVQSSAFNAKTRFVLVTAVGAKAHLAFGESPTADGDDFPVLENGSVFFGLNESAVLTGLKVSAYDGSS